jgi:hypothetical protein
MFNIDLDDGLLIMMKKISLIESLQVRQLAKRGIDDEILPLSGTNQVQMQQILVLFETCNFNH